MSDTTTTLTSIRAEVGKIDAAFKLELDDYRRALIDAACELHDLIDNLDHALSHGRPLPADWRR